MIEIGVGTGKDDDMSSAQEPIRSEIRTRHLRLATRQVCASRPFRRKPTLHVLRIPTGDPVDTSLAESVKEPNSSAS